MLPLASAASQATWTHDAVHAARIWESLRSSSEAFSLGLDQSSARTPSRHVSSLGTATPTMRGAVGGGCLPRPGTPIAPVRQPSLTAPPRAAQSAPRSPTRSEEALAAHARANSGAVAPFIRAGDWVYCGDQIRGFPARPCTPINASSLGFYIKGGARRETGEFPSEQPFASSRCSLGIYPPDIYVRRPIEPAAWVRSGAGIPSQRTPASAEQHHQADRG